MIEGFDFTVSNAPVDGIHPLCIIISIYFAEVHIIFGLDISNTLYNTILTNPEERFYPILPYLYMD